MPKTECQTRRADHGPMPRARLEAYHPPFTFTGVDLFGPLTVKWGRGTAKRWVCLFTCLTTCAVYLEVTPSLEADDFIMILRQFISRRGPPKEIWSDRGTNFIGANRELKESIAEWNEEKIERQLLQKGIKWVLHTTCFTSYVRSVGTRSANYKEAL